MTFTKDQNETWVGKLPTHDLFYFAKISQSTIITVLSGYQEPGLYANLSEMSGAMASDLHRLATWISQQGETV